jgi:hypothetical protein
VARVNVEQKALTDPRFRILGAKLGAVTTASKESVDAAFGMFLMVKVWNYCMEREILCVPSRDLEAIYPGLAAAMIDAHLGEFVRRSRAQLVRIKGGEGRLDWMKKAREAGKEGGPKGALHGVKGGRPRKNQKPPPGVSENQGRGLSENPPLTLTPALTPAPALTSTRSARATRTPSKHFVVPKVEEVDSYCREIGSKVDAQRFVDYYTANGWKVGKNAMKDWKAAVRNWHKNEQERGPHSHRNGKPTLAEQFNAGMSVFLAKGDTDDS